MAAQHQAVSKLINHAVSSSVPSCTSSSNKVLCLLPQVTEEQLQQYMAAQHQAGNKIASVTPAQRPPQVTPLTSWQCLGGTPITMLFLQGMWVCSHMAAQTESITDLRLVRMPNIRIVLHDFSHRSAICWTCRNQHKCCMLNTLSLDCCAFILDS